MEGTKVRFHQMVSGIQKKSNQFPHGSVINNLPVNPGDSGDVGSIPGSQRSRGGGNGNPFQNSCLENPMDRGAWRGCKELDTTEETQHARMHH